MGGFSIWHWLIIAIVIAIPGAIIYTAAKGVREEARLGTGITPGFKGWLLLLSIGVVLAPIRLLVDMAKYYSSPDISTMFQEFPTVTYIEVGQNAITLAISIVTAIFMLGKKLRFKSLFYIQYAITLVGFPLNALIVYIALRFRGIPVPLIGEEGLPDLVRWIGMSLVGALWVAYVAKSRRVAVTFVN